MSLLDGVCQGRKTGHRSIFRLIVAGRVFPIGPLLLSHSTCRET